MIIKSVIIFCTKEEAFGGCLCELMPSEETALKDLNFRGVVQVGGEPSRFYNSECPIHAKAPIDVVSQEGVA